MTEVEMQDVVERLLAEIRTIATPRLPTVLTKDVAARELSVSRKTLDRMVKDGRIQTCDLGMKAGGGIPRSEVERFGSPRSPPMSRPTGARRGPKPHAFRDAKTEAAAFRASLRKR